MSWLSYLFPLKVAKFSSQYNKEIRINEENEKLKLLVNGSRQSGAYIEMLWCEALAEFGLPDRALHILVLGVAGGTVIHLLRSRYPQAKITGVDIDRTMIDIGKQYFGLDKIGNLSFVCQDAEQFVKKERKTFDLIIVDLFIGTHVPELVRKISFLKNLKASLTKNGVVVINYLREFEYGEKSETLRQTLIKLFARVQEKDLHGNRFFLARMVK